MLGTFKRLDEAKRIIIDIETKDPLLKSKGASWVYDIGYIVGISIKVDQEPAEYYPLKHINETGFDREKIKNYIHSIPSSIFVVGHYLYYDLGWLNHGMNWFHKDGRFRDTLLTSQMYNNILPSHSLKAMGEHFQIGIKMDVGGDENIWKLPINTVAMRANSDVELTAKLDDKLWKERDSAACVRECQLIPILVQMKRQGVKIDVEQLDTVQKYLEGKFKATMQEIPEISNINASASIATFFRKLGVPYTQTTNIGRPSFPSWYLESLDHPKIKKLTEARKLHKLINTFCVGIRQSIADDGHIHPDFFNGRSGDGGTVTGRLSCAHPNKQQIPNRTDDGKLLRSAFIPENGIWFKFDYSQQEPKLMLHYASKLNLNGIDKWRMMYQNNPNQDFYEPLQHMLDIERFPAKTYTLGICYNMGYEKLARMNHMPEETAKSDIIRFRRSVPWLIALKQFCTDRALDKGKLRTLGDRYLTFNNANASDAFNHFIQGSAADQTKEAMLQIYNNFGLVPLSQVHDELNFDLSEEQYLDGLDTKIAECMRDVFKLDFPTKIDIKMGHNWKECD